MNVASIYYLYCPIQNQPFYIGRTIGKLGIRLSGHIYKSKRKSGEKSFHIDKILKAGKKPSIVLIDEVEASEAGFWEAHYVSLLKSWGFRLVNSTDGGEVHYRYGKFTRKHRKNMSAGMSKYKKPVAQYDMQGNYIREWDSIRSASKGTKIRKKRISSCCKSNRMKNGGGFIWRFKSSPVIKNNSTLSLGGEIWMDIFGYEDSYQISSLGRVKSLHRIVRNSSGRSFLPERILKPCINSNGYYQVALNKKNKHEPIAIHSLVARHFIPNPNSKPSVNHIDGDKLNNLADNLEWATWSENLKHAYDNNLRSPVGKKIVQMDLHGNKIKEWSSAVSAAKELNIPHQHIQRVCSGKRRSTRGFKWVYHESVKKNK